MRIRITLYGIAVFLFAAPIVVGLGWALCALLVAVWYDPAGKLPMVGLAIWLVCGFIVFSFRD